MSSLISLNLGCGTNKKEGFINIDKSKLVAPDLQLDLSKDKFPYPDNSVDYIEAIDIVEHIADSIHLFNECWRVLKAGCYIKIETPKAGTNDFYKDPTHVKPFVADTFKYFADWNTCPAYEIKTWMITNLTELPMRLIVSMTPKK